MMKQDQCPYCGADAGMQEICPSCGRTLSEEAENDPFASAMAQERHVKEQLAAMREKYRSELPEQPRPAQASAEQTAAGTEDHTAEEPDTPAPAEPPKKKSSLPYTLAFCGLLLAICGGTLLLPELMKDRPKKNDSYALYSKGKDLWFYSGKKREPVLISEGTLPETDTDTDDLAQFTLNYLQASLYDDCVYYDAEQNLLWYPDGIEADAEATVLDEAFQSCRLLCRNLKTSEETVITDSLSLTDSLYYFSRPIQMNSLGISQALSPDEYVNIRPPYLFVGDMIYYIDSERRLMRSNTKGGTPETVAESVYRFWKAQDGQTVLFLSADEDGKAFINPQNGHLAVYSNDVEDSPVIYSLDNLMVSGSIIRVSSTPETQFEMAEVPFSLCQVKNGEQPKTVCSGLSGWSTPQTACANFIMYSVPEDEKNTYSFRRYDTNTQKETTLFIKDDVETGEYWETYSLCCYPNGDCYFAGGNKSTLCINPYWYSSSISPADTARTESYSLIFEPVKNSSGVWFYDAEKDKCTFLFSPIDAIQTFSGVGSCCRTDPYIIGSSGFQSTIYHREQECYKTFKLPERTYAAAFSPAGNYLLCGIHDSSYQTTTLMYADLKKPGAIEEYYDLATANEDIPPFLTWYTDPDTGMESALLEEYKTVTYSEPDEAPAYVLPDLRAGDRVLKQAEFSGRADAYGQIYALNNCLTINHLTSGTLNRLDKDAWTPIAHNVKNFVSVSKDSMYLVIGQTDSELQFIADNRSYLLDRNVGILLKAEGFAE